MLLCQVDSEVPAGAGISSSSSLVCSAALAALTLFTKGEPWKKISRLLLFLVWMISVGVKDGAGRRVSEG